MNGLQMVASLLSLQSRQAQSAKAAEQLTVAQIASPQSAACTAVSTHWITSERSTHQYLETLCHDLAGILPGDGAERNLAVEGIALEVPTSIGIPLRFIVSELVTINEIAVATLGGSCPELHFD